jgi:hypothetical protein
MQEQRYVCSEAEWRVQLHVRWAVRWRAVSAVTGSMPGEQL